MGALLSLELDGPLDAPLLVVGRDPGAREVYEGRPFVGDSGQLLDRALAQSAYPRPAVAVTNVVAKRPLGNDWKAHLPGDVEAGVAALRKVLEFRATRGLKVVLACGEQATLACLGADPTGSLSAHLGEALTVLRGYPFVGHAGCVVIPTVHPAFMLHGLGPERKGNWLPWWPLFCWDAQKAARLAKAGGWSPPEHRERVGATAPEVGGEGLLAVDIETTKAVEPECIGFAWSAEDACAFPFQGNEDTIRKVLGSPRPKVFHNGQFDVTVLERHGFAVEAWEHDTSLLWHAVEPTIAGQSGATRSKRTEKSLRFLGSVLTDEPFWKDYAFQTEEEQWRLCARDARVTWVSAARLLERLTGMSPSSS